MFQYIIDKSIDIDDGYGVFTEIFRTSILYIVIYEQFNVTEVSDCEKSYYFR